MAEKIKNVDEYLIKGCMRCSLGNTAACKVNTWKPHLLLLRDVLLESGLEEGIKWGVPIYMMKGKNVVSLGALKDCVVIGFFKGVLLSDPHQILEQQGQIHAARIIRFTREIDIINKTPLLHAYIAEAIGIEERSEQVPPRATQDPVPPELEEAFAQDPLFQEAFERLTPGRQRAYLIHFSQAKQSQTRQSRIDKYRQQILDGIGLHDQYKRREEEM